jgi:hypothetical protein
MLRRYSQTYESLYGPIPRDSRNGRVYTADTLRLFLDVRTAVNRGDKVEDAFQTLNTDLQVTPKAQPPTLANNEALALLRSLHDRIQLLESEIKALRSLPRPKSSLEIIRDWLKGLLTHLQ